MAEAAINSDVEYIHKDVFDARMDRRKILMKMKANNGSSFWEMERLRHPS